MAQLNKGPWQVFDADWFKSHQSSLLSWLNGPWLKRKLSRHAFRIEATEPITEIAPSHYVVKLSETQRRADFRTHPKYAKRLYYSLIAYWWFLHFLDWAVLDRFVPQYSFGLSELLTAKSADGEGGTTCDGYAARVVTAGTTFSSVRTGAGTSNSNTTTAGVLVRHSCHADTDKYTAIRRAGFSFDTSAVGATSTVLTAKLYLHSANTYDVFTFDAFDTSNYMLYLVSFTPTDPGAIVSGDYNSFGASEWGKVGYDEYIAVEDYSEFALTDVANLHKDGITSLGVRIDSDFSNAPLTWKSSADIAVGVRWVDYTGTVSDPYLDVTYDLAPTTVYKPSAIIIS